MDDVIEWRNRPLDKSYAVVYLDALRVNRPAGRERAHKKRIRGSGSEFRGKKGCFGARTKVRWIAETEGAKFWMGVLNELKNRGVEDILIACMDGLSGFPDAVRAVFPQTHVQLCIVHMVRNSTKYVSYKDLKRLCADLKAVYSAPGEEAGRAALDDFGKIRDGKYPMIRQSWENHWNDLSEFFKYPPEIRKAIYTTNAIESLNYQLRKVTRNRLTFVNDDAIFKVLYLAIHNASKKWTMPIKQWGMVLNQVSHFVRKRAGSALLAKCYLHKTSDRPCFSKKLSNHWKAFDMAFFYINYGFV
jgi:transposase-like protein